MPRDCTSDFIAALNDSVLRPAFFVEANFVSGPVYLWSGRGSLEWNGNTWLGLGSLGSISTVEEASTIEAKGITLTLSGIDANIAKLTLSEYQVGLPVLIYLALFDETGTLIDSPVLAFSGRMDQPTIAIDNKSCTISINCESKLLLMNNSVQRRYTNDDQQLDYPGDRGFEYVDSIQQMTIYWGRTPSSKNNI
jgi:hypothetical protein